MLKQTIATIAIAITAFTTILLLAFVFCCFLGKFLISARLGAC